MHKITFCMEDDGIPVCWFASSVCLLPIWGYKQIVVSMCMLFVWGQSTSGNAAHDDHHRNEWLILHCNNDVVEEGKSHEESHANVSLIPGLWFCITPIPCMCTPLSSHGRFLIPLFLSHREQNLISQPFQPLLLFPSLPGIRSIKNHPPDPCAGCLTKKISWVSHLCDDNRHFVCCASPLITFTRSSCSEIHHWWLAWWKAGEIKMRWWETWWIHVSGNSRERQAASHSSVNEWDRRDVWHIIIIWEFWSKNSEADFNQEMHRVLR